MAGITLAHAEAQLTAWLAASEAVAGSKSYTISTSTGSRTLTRADAEEVRRMVDYWQGWVTRLSAPGSPTSRYAVFNRS